MNRAFGRPRTCDITDVTRDLARGGNCSGTSGTDKREPLRRGAVLVSSPVRERRRAYGGSPARTVLPPCEQSKNLCLMTSRHAARHLTTLRPVAGGEPARRVARLATSGIRTRRITRTRLGATAETRVIRAKGSKRFLPVWQGELVYGDFAHRYIARAACVERRSRPCVVGAHSLEDHWGLGGTSRERRLPNRFD